MACPTCNSDDWKLASLVYEEGLQVVDTRTSGGAVGVGTGGFGGGVASGKTTGTVQSALSQRASPPSGMPMTTLCMVAFLLTTVFGLFKSIWFAVAGLCLVGAIAMWPSEAKAHQATLEIWRKTRMCLRCGHFYVPLDDSKAPHVPRLTDEVRR